MLDTPCPACGHLLDVNENACPHCGLSRRRGVTRPRRSPWLAISICVLVGGWLGWIVALGIAQGETRSGFVFDEINGAVSLGALLGLLFGILLARRHPCGE